MPYPMLLISSVLVYLIILTGPFMNLRKTLPIISEMIVVIFLGHLGPHDKRHGCRATIFIDNQSYPDFMPGKVLLPYQAALYAGPAAIAGHSLCRLAARSGSGVRR